MKACIALALPLALLTACSDKATDPENAQTPAPSASADAPVQKLDKPATWHVLTPRTTPQGETWAVVRRDGPIGAVLLTVTGNDRMRHRMAVSCKDGGISVPGGALPNLGEWTRPITALVCGREGAPTRTLRGTEESLPRQLAGMARSAGSR